LRDRPGVERRVALEVRRLALLTPAAVALKPPLLPLPLGVLHEGSIGSGVATIARPRELRVFFRDAQYQAAGEARPSGGAAAAGEPPLALDSEDAHAPPRRGGRRRRRERDRGAAP